jgi:hypothetical protein
MGANGDGRSKDAGAAQLYADILARVRAKIAEVRAEHGGPRLTVDVMPELPPKLRKPIAETTTDELIAEMIRDRDETYARAAEAWANYERRKAAYELDSQARAWRKSTGGRGLQ